jgi:hypothetical protein
VAFGFASLAQILLIVGGTVALSAVIARFLRRNGTAQAERATTDPQRVDVGAG